MAGIYAPFDTDGGATFKRMCALRGITGVYLKERRIVTKSTLTRLMRGKPISNDVRRRIVAVFDAVPIDSTLVPRELLGESA